MVYFDRYKVFDVKEYRNIIVITVATPKFRKKEPPSFSFCQLSENLSRFPSFLLLFKKAP